MDTINKKSMEYIAASLQTGLGAYLIERPTEDDLLMSSMPNEQFVFDLFESKKGEKNIVVRLKEADEKKQKQKRQQRDSADNNYERGMYRSAKGKYEFLLSTTGYLGPIVYYRLAVCYYKQNDFDSSLYFFNLAKKLYTLKEYDVEYLDFMIALIEQEQRENKKGTINEFPEPKKPSLIRTINIEEYVLRELKSGVDLNTLLTSYRFTKEELLMVKLIVAKQALLQNRKKVADALIKSVEQSKDKCVDVIDYMQRLQQNKTLYLAKGKTKAKLAVRTI